MEHAFVPSGVGFVDELSPQLKSSASHVSTGENGREISSRPDQLVLRAVSTDVRFSSMRCAEFCIWSRGAAKRFEAKRALHRCVGSR